MRIVPVIDLKGGQVVLAVACRRDEYRPVVSRLCSSAEPAEVVQALVDTFGFETAYVADLDAIGGAEPNWSEYERIARAGLKLWVDAGSGEMARARTMAERQLAQRQAEHDRPLVEKVVVGLETLAFPETLADMVEQIGTDRIMLSLDLRDGQPVAAAAEWADSAIEEVFDHALRCGVEQFIVLDLARVGTGTGSGTEAVCSRLRGQAPQAYLAAGGGLRDEDDIRGLLAAGCNAVLVASALHDGRIAPGNIASWNGKQT